MHHKFSKNTEYNISSMSIILTQSHTHPTPNAAATAIEMCDIQPLSMACPNTFTARRPNFGAQRLCAHAPPLPRRRRIKARSRPHFGQTQVALQHSDSWKILVFQQRYRNKRIAINFHIYLSLSHLC